MRSGEGGRGAIVAMVAVLVAVPGAAPSPAMMRRPLRPRCPATSVEPGLLERAQANPSDRFHDHRPERSRREGCGVGVRRPSRARTISSSNDGSRPSRPSRLRRAASKSKVSRQGAVQGRARAASGRARCGTGCSEGRPAVSSVTSSTSSTASRSRSRVAGWRGSPSGPASHHHRGRAGRAARQRPDVQQPVLVPAALGLRVRGQPLWYATPQDMPAIAIVDSGIDATLRRLRRARTSSRSTSSAPASRTRARRRSRSRHVRGRRSQPARRRTTPAWLRTRRSSRSTSWTTTARPARVT